jgi:hypothetical protein
MEAVEQRHQHRLLDSDIGSKALAGRAPLSIPASRSIPISSSLGLSTATSVESMASVTHGAGLAPPVV